MVIYFQEDRWESFSQIYMDTVFACNFMNVRTVCNSIMLNLPEEEVDILQADEEGNCLLPDNCLHLK
jgi:hypothetical protein